MVKYSIQEITACRLCGCSDLKRVFRSRSVPFFDEVVPASKFGSEFLHPLEIFFCKGCCSLQTLHEVNIQEYYNTYEYVASDSAFVRRYMNLVVEDLMVRFLSPGDRVIEVGAADGYFLELFKEKGLRVLGFEAAENLAKKARERNVEVINKLFDYRSIEILPDGFRTAQLITMLHTFDHLFEPAKFLKDALKVLDAKRGILLLEVHDFADIYDKYEVSLFGHEHATYLHFSSMRRLLEAHGYRLVDFNFVDKKMCRGSSMLVLATPQSSSIVAKIDDASFERPELDLLENYVEFSLTVEAAFERARNFIRELRKQGKRLAGYGGWGRGVTTLAMLDLQVDELEFVVDANVGLAGSVTPGSGFPIVGPDKLRIEDADVVIVFNYAYLEEIKARNSEYIERGGRFISIIDILGIDKDKPY